MTSQELQRLGFVSREHYDSTIKTLQSDLTGEYAAGGTTGEMLMPAAAEKISTYFKARRTEGQMWTRNYSVGQYPAQCDLTAKMPPVYDQGPRGTCVAQAMTGLANYYFGSAPVLSAEYTYGRLKEYEYAEYVTAYQLFMTEPVKYCHPESGDTPRDFNKDRGTLSTAAWYLQQRFPLEVQREVQRRNAMQQQGKEGPVKFSSRDLLQLFKQINPGIHDGSYLEVACRVFLKEGFCAHDVLPYSFKKDPGNSGHLPMPEYAIRDAAERKITDELRLFHMPGNIDEFKKFLSGNNGQWEPMPVALSVPCFASWCNNPFTKRTGWFSMPLPDERKFNAYLKSLLVEYLRQNPEATEEELEEVYADLLKQLKDVPMENFLELLEDFSSGHAMLAVGYVDEPFVAGGGYLIVRNSWNDQWAWDSEYPGHAKIPYAFIEHFCYAALSIVKPLQGAPRQKEKKEADVEKSKSPVRVKGDLPPSEIAIIPFTDDAEAERETLHLTHRLSKAGFQVRMESAQLPEGELKELLSGRTEKLRDVILLAGPGSVAAGSGNALEKEIARLTGAGANIIPVQFGKANPDWPENYRKLFAGNRMKFYKDSFNDDFSELTMRLKSTPQADPQQSRVLYENFRNTLRSTAGILETNNQAAIPGLYELLEKNMTFRLLEKLVLYWLRRGGEVLKSNGSRLTPAKVSETMADPAVRAITLASGSGDELFHIALDKEKRMGRIGRKRQIGQKLKNVDLNGIYRCLKLFVTPVTAGAAASCSETDKLMDSVLPKREAPAPAPAAAGNTAVQQEVPAAPVQKKEQVQTPAKQQQEDPAVSEALYRKVDFLNMVDRNICRLDTDYCFPDLNLPLKYKLMPWRLRIKEVIKLDCSFSDVNSCLEKYGVITAADREQVEKTSDIALYELKHGSISVLVIALYLTLRKNGQKVAMGSACLNALQELKENFTQSMRNLCSSDLVGAGFLIATGNEAKEPDYQKCTSSFRGGNGDFTVFCDYNAPLEKWSFVFPENWDGYYWWHFMEHLLPVDPAVCLKTLIEQGNYGESTTQKRLEKNLELPHAIFNSAFARVKPLLRKKKEMGSDPDGKEAVQYELDPEKSDEKFATHANCRRITRGIWSYFHCVVFSGSFVVAGMLGEAIKAPVWLRILMLGGASFIAKIITEWNDRRISR